MKRKTKIIATIGPSSANEKTLKKFKEYGVNCLRFNTAHGDIETHKKWIKLSRKIADFCLLIDVKGPEIRIRTENFQIKKDEEKKFYFKTTKPYFSYDFYEKINVKDTIFFDNGQIEGKVTEKNGDSITVKFFEDCLIKPNKGVNIPNKTLGIPSLSKRDKEYIEFAKEQNIDYIALSFVRYKKDVEDLKKLIKGTEIGIISKIENHQGIENIDEIIDSSDGIMIARGDLGVEIPEQRIPILQKNIIQKCNQKAKISIVATQMLESMIYNKIPTRAEVSDVANAILDGADVVMLSGETAAGKYPEKSVRVMDKVAREVEDETPNKVDMQTTHNVSEEMSKAAFSVFKKTAAVKLVTPTRSGYSARLISRFRLKKTIISITDNSTTKRKLELVWGVKPIYTNTFPEVALITSLTIFLKRKQLIKDSECIVYFAGVKTLKEQVSNLLEIHYVKDLLNHHKNYVEEESKKLTKTLLRK
ncbi:MAG: pyruvate kinase [Candidatus Woesearchaeota archaeon]